MFSPTPEPVSQMGLHFDTEVNTVSDEMYTVKATELKCWLMMTKHVRKKMSAKVHPNPGTMFDKRKSGVKIRRTLMRNLRHIHARVCEQHHERSGVNHLKKM